MQQNGEASFTREVGVVDIGKLKNYAAMKTEAIAMTRASVETLLDDIILDVTWSRVARRYFDRSASWIYNKMNGRDSNGGEGGFTYAEKIQLRAALFDFAERVRTAAHAIDV